MTRRWYRPVKKPGDMNQTRERFANSRASGTFKKASPKSQRWNVCRPEIGLQCAFSCVICPAALTFLFSSEKKSNKRKRRPWPKCSAGPWDGYTLVCCGLQGISKRHGAGFLPVRCYGWAWWQIYGLVLFWGYLAYTDGKKRHHQAMGGGMAMGLLPEWGLAGIGGLPDGSFVYLMPVANWR